MNTASLEEGNALCDELIAVFTEDANLKARHHAIRKANAAICAHPDAATLLDVGVALARTDMLFEEGDEMCARIQALLEKLDTLQQQRGVANLPCSSDKLAALAAFNVDQKARAPCKLTKPWVTFVADSIGLT